MKNNPEFKLSVIIPCFNEESGIQFSYKRLVEEIMPINCLYEIIFVNDGSQDNTLNLLEEIAKIDRSVIVINLSRNFGHQAAVASGIHFCTGDYAVIMDADLQDPPELIPIMIQKIINEKCNVVFGVRKKRKGETLIKKLFSSIYYRLLNLFSEFKIPVDTGDFRLIDKKVINVFKSLTEKHKYIRGLISWMGFKQCPVYYDREPRISGETKYSFYKLITFAFFGLLYFSKKPLKLATGLGVFSLFIGMILILYLIISTIFTPEKIVPGWASLLTTVIFFGGIQLISIGVLGEYIGNIFDEVKNRPEYIVESIIKNGVNETEL